MIDVSFLRYQEKIIALQVSCQMSQIFTKGVYSIKCSFTVKKSFLNISVDLGKV